ncbi:MAG: zinc-binding alcohol dehydrogenase family protein [Chloroflexi bacterium]|nr:zinc-binding alcohol dehydrogenase family protein [Chloroflexota bacterium]
MKALRFKAFGPPDNAEVSELLIPEPGPGEVRVRMRAAGVNPSDVKILAGLMSNVRPPRVLGRDFAGVVDATGEGVDQNLRGRPVYGTSGVLGSVRDGTFADYVVVPRDTLRPMPPHLSFLEAAGVGLAFATAWISLVEVAGLKPGESVLVYGATGGVGGAAVQIAVTRRAKIIAISGDDGKADTLRALGVEDIINYRHHRISERVRSITQGEGVNVVLNVVGGQGTFDDSLSCLAPFGRLVCLSSPVERTVSFDLLSFYRRNLRILGVNTLAIADEHLAQALEALEPDFNSGAIRVRIAQSYALTEGRQALEAVKAGRAMGKVVLEMA